MLLSTLPYMRYVFFICCFGLFSCAYKPLDPVVSIEQNTPETWSQNIATPSESNIYWEAMQDDVLAKLVKQSLESNLDIQSAAKAISASRIQLENNEARHNVNYGISQSSSIHQSKLLEKTTVFNINGFASYEVDLWGAAQNSIDSAELSFENSKISKESLTISLVAELTDAYTSLRAIDEQLVIRQEILENTKQLYSFTLQRYKMGFLTAVDVEQQKNNITSLEYALDDLKLSRISQQQRLSILTGQAPHSLTIAPINNYSPPILRLAPNTPADILRSRPDIRAQENLLAQSYLNFEIARKAFYPQLNLTANTNVINQTFSQFITGNLFAWNVGANLITTLLDNGSRDRNVASSRIAAEQQMLSYQKTIYKALEEVEQALRSQAINVREIENNQLQQQLQHHINNDLQAKYNVGLVSSEQLINQQNQLLNTKLSTISANLNATRSTITLLRVTGRQPA